MSSRNILGVAGILLAFAVMLGAVGTHIMRARLAPDQLAIYETAVRYHFYNALGLLALGAVSLTWDSQGLRVSAWLIIAGIVLFSGALYLAALGAPRVIHVLPPFGGVAWIAGWVLFAVAVWRR